MWTASAIALLALLLAVDGNIIAYTQDTPHSIMEEFLDMPADFGPDIPIEGIRGFLVAGVPSDGCTNMTKPPDDINFTGRWIVLIAKHNCSYETQIRNAQAAGFDAAIVHNVNSSELVIMAADDPDGITISSVFVSDLVGLILSEEYLYINGFYIMVNSDVPFNINTHLLLPFAIVVALCLLVILIFMIVKCIKDRRRARRHRLPNRALKKIPTCKFSKGDPYETCAICLDDYQEGERLRVLPCAHAYHSACIDPWLTQNKRVCPVCKRRVFAAGERRRAHSDSSDSSDQEPLLATPPNTQNKRVCPVCKRRVFAAGERRRAHSDSSDSSDQEPLLATPPNTQGGTFDEQRENPFARATRFMVRLRARANGEPEIPPSPPNDTEHMNAANDENGNTEDTAPLVPAVSTLSERRTRRARRPRSARTRPAPAPAPAAAPQHSINTNGRGEIGVAAIPASTTPSRDFINL